MVSAWAWPSPARSNIASARALERRSRLAPGESDADAAFAIFADAGRTVNTANPSSMEGITEAGRGRTFLLDLNMRF